MSGTYFNEILENYSKKEDDFIIIEFNNNNFGKSFFSSYLSSLSERDLAMVFYRPELSLLIKDDNQEGYKSYIIVEKNGAEISNIKFCYIHTETNLLPRLHFSSSRTTMFFTAIKDSHFSILKQCDLCMISIIRMFPDYKELYLKLHWEMKVDTFLENFVRDNDIENFKFINHFIIKELQLLAEFIIKSSQNYKFSPDIITDFSEKLTLHLKRRNLFLENSSPPASPYLSPL